MEPDEGGREDVDKELVGREAGSPAGDLSAEEAAIHEETDQAATGGAIEEQTATNEEPTS